MRLASLSTRIYNQNEIIKTYKYVRDIFIIIYICMIDNFSGFLIPRN